MENYQEFFDAGPWPDQQQVNNDPFFDTQHVDGWVLFNQEAGSHPEKIPELIPENLGSFGISHDLQLSNFFPNLEGPTLGELPNPADLSYSHSEGTEASPISFGATIQVTPPWSFDTNGSSTISEGFSPSSDQMYPISPTWPPVSPVTSFELPQLPLYPESSALNISFDFNTNFGPRVQDLGAPNLLPSVPQPGRRGRYRQVGQPHIPMRELRKRNRPEKCPFSSCEGRYQYKALLRRHINVQHHSERGVPKETHTCTVCRKVYARSDGLYRHGMAKHGWPKGGKKGRGWRDHVDGGDND